MNPDILVETEFFVAVNKPAGLLSIPDREGKDISLKRILKDKYGEIFVVHRLDRETSGVIVFAKDDQTHKYLSMAFEDRSVQKFYQGIVNGSPEQTSGTIDEPIMEHPGKKGMMIINKKGKSSVTDYSVEEEFGKFSLVHFQIHTGRTHQIRVHMQSLGHPVLCDELYGDPSPILLSSFKKNYNLKKDELDERPILARLALHSHRLEFTGNDGIEYKIEAPMPKDMRALLQQLRKWKSR